jgi:hypothetical protein
VVKIIERSMVLEEKYREEAEMEKVNSIVGKIHFIIYDPIRIFHS